MLKKLKFLLVLAAVFAVAGCKAEVENETPKCTITYDENGHGTAQDSKIVEKGYKLTDEDLPALTEAGFNFGGWEIEGKLAAIGDVVEADITLKAVWTDWEKVATPTFSVAAGEVDKGTKVKITCTTEGAVIYYTVDGSAPTAGSTKYENEIEITAATTIKAFAVKSGMKDSTVAEVTYTVDVIPPANVTDLTAKCTASQTVKLTWTNPTDTDFAKVVITYEPGNGNVTVAKTDSPNNEATVAGLTNDTEYTFTVKAYDNSANASSGVNKKCTPFLGTAYKATGYGGLEGYTNQTQGETVKETWVTDSGYLKIDGTEIPKTSEVIAVPTGTVAKINMTSSDAKGDLFTSSRKVKLSPFVMSKYPVTRGLFKAVMDDYYDNIKDNQAVTTGTEDKNPINYVNWFDAIVFCNKLSMKCGLAPVYSYDFGNGKMTNPDDWFKDTTNLSASVPTSSSSTNYSNWKDKVVINLKANGYRLPTDAEWEFCARGGDPNADDWGYTYSGSNTVTEVAWYKDNSNDSGTNIVGYMNKANKLGLYDMSGNVNEWCDDYYNDSATVDDDKYKDSEGYVKDPLVVSVYSARRRRGGGWHNYAGFCEVCMRNFEYPYNRYNYYGFRLVRSTEVESN